MQLNYSKINQLVNTSKYSKREIVNRCGFSRPTLDGLLKGGDVKISTLISFAQFFNMPISYFFDEETSKSVIGDNNQINDSFAHHNINGVMGDQLLQERISHLEETISEKDARISEYKERISELKDRIEDLKK